MKKRILIWGTGVLYAVLQREIQLHLDDVEILALINNDVNSPKMIDGYPIITKQDISKYKYDEIVIVAVPQFERSIRQDAEAVGVPPHKLVSFVNFLEGERAEIDSIEDDVAVQLRVLQEILIASDEQIHDFDWMYQKVCEYGVFGWNEDSCKFKSICCTRNGMIQIPEEFAKFCLFLAHFKINNAIEIGVFRGRSSYFMCAVLMRNNPTLKYTMVDIADYLDHFDAYKQIMPALEKVIPSTSEDYKGCAYDFVFIDADHSYDASIKDYFNVGKYANKLVAFHDIYAHEYDAENGGTVRMWKEVMEHTKDKEHKIFSKYPERMMGIGCVQLI